MKKKSILLILSATLVMSMVGCHGKLDGEASNNVQEVNEAEVTEDSKEAELQAKEDEESGEATKEDEAVTGGDASEEEAEDDTSNAYDDTAWQQAYMMRVNDIANGKNDMTIPYYGYNPGDEDYESATAYLEAAEYYVYDIDKNGVPELIIKYGTCEADYDGVIFTYNEKANQVEYVGEYGLSHTSLATYPNGNGMITLWGHMGSQNVSLATMGDGKLSYEEIFDETLDMMDPDVKYTPLDDISKGSVFLCSSPIKSYYAITEYRTWYADLDADIKPTEDTDSDLENKYIDTIVNNGQVRGVSGEGYFGDTDTMDLDDFLAPGGFHPYNQKGFYVNQYAFADVNHDGKTECILELGENGDDTSVGVTKADSYIVLSYQYGKMYSYVLEYMCGSYVPLINGSFKPVDEYYAEYGCKRILIDAGQAYVYFVKGNDNYDEVTWKGI